VTVLGWLIVLVIWSVVSAVGLLLSILYTNPGEIGPVGVTAWFVIFLSCAASIATLALHFSKAFLHVHATGVSRLRYSWRQGFLIGGWVTGLLALSSLHQLTIPDGILLALLLVIVEIYVRFRWP
jgi:hypothetical protein